MLSVIQEKKKTFNYKHYENFDQCPNMTYMLEATQLMTTLPMVKAIKKRAMQQLDLQEGEIALEVGCGFGYDAELLQRAVGLAGEVVAMDSSQHMIQLAKKNHPHSKVNYICNKAVNYPLPDNYFSAIFIDRLLVSQQNINQHLAECYRVLKQGGRIVLIDLDFETIYLYPTMQGRIQKLLHWLATQLVRNPIIGRQLHHYLAQHPFSHIQTTPHAYQVNDFNLLTKMVDIPNILNDMVDAMLYTAEEKQEMLHMFKQANTQKLFIYGMMLFVAYATKPHY